MTIKRKEKYISVNRISILMLSLFVFAGASGCSEGVKVFSIRIVNKSNQTFHHVVVYISKDDEGVLMGGGIGPGGETTSSGIERRAGDQLRVVGEKNGQEMVRLIPLTAVKVAPRGGERNYYRLEMVIVDSDFNIEVEAVSIDQKIE
jgi:hypothetical protein